MPRSWQIAAMSSSSSLIQVEPTLALNPWPAIRNEIFSPRRRTPKYGEIGEPQTAGNCCQELSRRHVSGSHWEYIRHRVEGLKNQQPKQAGCSPVKRNACRQSEEAQGLFGEVLRDILT